MKHIITLIFFLVAANFCHAQYFQATISKEGTDLVFKIRPNPTGGDVAARWSDIEFFVRWPNGSPAFNFGAITVNTTDFPGISIPNNGSNVQGAENGFTNNWFGTSFSVTNEMVYTAGVEYEVFRVALDVPASAINFELIHNTFFSPTYLALIGGSGNDLTNPVGNVFYGTTAMTCTNCPSTTFGVNHVDSGGSPVLPIELSRFEAYKYNEQDARLDWTTLSEINSSHFDIERSLDAQNWETIAHVVAAGFENEDTYYSFLDEAVFNPSTGPDLFYYRLKMVDLDASFEYSEIRAVRFESLAPTATVYPNPTTDGVYLDFRNKNQTAKVQLYLFDVAGRLMIEKELNHADLENTYYLDLNQKNLSPGTYMLRLIEGDRNILVKKLIVQRL
ncbi:MAG: T9SS type A sorting domain-containing protein [Bacteroidota bacterium]